MRLVKSTKDDRAFSEERLAVRAALSNCDFMVKFLSIYNKRYILSEYNRKILDWGIGFYHKYSDIPGIAHTYDVFLEKTRHMDKEEASNYELTLAYLMDSSTTDINVEYALDRTIAYFNERALTILVEDIQNSSKAPLEERIGIVEAYNRLSGFGKTYSNPFTDADLIARAFSHHEPLFYFPGALGKMLNPQLTKSSFIAFLGREKIGKTWTLSEFAFHALRNRRKVAYFQLGDMTEEQQTKRWGIRIRGISDSPMYAGEHLFPVADCYYNQICECEDRPPNNYESVLVKSENKDFNGDTKLELCDYWERSDHEVCTMCRNFYDKNSDLTAATRKRFKGAYWFDIFPHTPHEDLTDGFNARTALGNWYYKRGAAPIRLSSHSSGSLSLKNMKGILSAWKKEDGFVPDVVVVDYADIIGTQESFSNSRDKINAIWLGLRNISTDIGCCLITATQADSESYTKWLLSLSNFSEDKRKYGHVTAFFGLNQTQDEKKHGVLRINPLMLREGSMDSRSYVTILQDLSRGQAYLDSF